MTDYGSVTVAVEGCCHGELDTIYATIASQPAPVDLLIICGDFQCVRNTTDLNFVSVPDKYKKLNTFQDYISGVKRAPVLTIFIGGNHEASNILHDLYYGGWVAPNIYFLGFAGVVWFNGLKISGISGIYNHHHYFQGHYESFPYSHDMVKSIYHVRELEIFRLMHLSNSLHSTDIMVSHDWPQGIWNHGDKQTLLRIKPFFREDMENGKLGCSPFMDLLKAVKPRFWFAAHLHVKFAAIYSHGDTSATTDLHQSDSDTPVCKISDGKNKSTRFLALDKVLPGRDFLQLLQIPRQRPPSSESKLEYDIEWLAILKSTHYLLSTIRGRVFMPMELTQPSEEVR